MMPSACSRTMHLHTRYVSGAAGARSNGSDAFQNIQSALEAAGTKMTLVLNCLFWVAAEECIDPFFGGFHQIFNVENFPPPSRTEFVGLSPFGPTPAGELLAGANGQSGGNNDDDDYEGSDDGKCPLVMKCVAAMPAA